MSFAGRLRAVPVLGSSAFASVGKRVFPPADLAVQRATRGRLSLSGTVGMPLMLLTTTGRRTGEPRVTPVTYAEDGGDLLVIGSNWGQERHPGWALNLRADPQATAEIRGRRTDVTARVLQGAERDAALALLLRVWPHFDAYAKRAQNRELLVFRLTER
ncbi:MAG TPA: nitroreductase family deazaflavin-dependent oxidoreductase [Actinocrinis sp.]|nr:nitroreductase family deazaflavin-dependent oxidoreductase [Actinocrinis sp.]